MRLEGKFSRDPNQDLADVRLNGSVTLELVRSNGVGEWEVWAVRIDGHLYREPRDLEGELLKPGPFSDALDAAFDQAMASSPPNPRGMTK